MMKNLKTDVNKRGVIFEELARMYLRNENNNNFIFCTRNIDNMKEFANKYRFDFSKISLSIMDFLDKKLKKVDLIEFLLSDKDSRVVENFVFYEVKSKTQINKERFDMCESSFNAYSFLQENNLSCNLVSFVLFDDWKYSFKVHDLDLLAFRKYSRYKS